MALDIKYIVDSLANEKELPKDVVFKMVESALAAATVKKMFDKQDVTIRVEIDKDTGTHKAFRSWEIVEDDDELLKEFPEKYLTLEQAKQKHLNEGVSEELEVGVLVEEPLESVNFGRIETQYAKNVILQKVKEAEANKIAKNYASKIGEILTGSVKKVSRDSISLDMGNGATAIIRKNDAIPRESFRLNDRVRAYLYEVHTEPKGAQLLMSRTCPEMLVKLFEIEVPEISEEVIEVKSAARDPGSRAKIAVKTNDGRIDPVGACVGMRGSRVQAISNELNGERIDIILWDDNPVQLVINAMAPAEVSSITVDEDNKSMDVIVAEDQLSQAIGRNGQNVRLASELTGWKLNILAESDAIKKDEEESKQTMKLFIEQLGVDEDLGMLLIQEGFSTIKDIAYAPEQDLLSIEELDEDIVEALRSRANDILLAQTLADQAIELSEGILKLEGMTPDIARALYKEGIKTLEDLADQAVFDICEIEGLNEEKAAQLIMQARAPWFEANGKDGNTG